MLTLTLNAASAIRSLVNEPELPDTAGLRIAPAVQSGGEEALTAEITGGAGPDDQVIETEGARVFLDPAAATALDRKSLDVEVGEQGQLRFQVMEAE